MTHNNACVVSFEHCRRFLTVLFINSLQLHLSVALIDVHGQGISHGILLYNHQNMNFKISPLDYCKHCINPVRLSMADSKLSAGDF